MRTALTAMMSVVVACGLGVATAQSREPSSLLLRQPAAVERMSFDQDLALTAVADQPAGESPSDKPGEKAEAPATAAAPCQCQSCCDACAGPKPWSIPQPCILQNMGIKLGGWLQQGVTFNGLGRGQGFNGTVGTNDFNGEYQMNQLWMFLDRPVKTDGCGWDIGGHVDAIYGTDWRFGINHGLEDRINGFDRQSYGLVIPQAYLEIGYDDLSVKLGHFAGILGYEVVPAVMNPLYSHSYAMAFSEPLLVTGVLAEYKATDSLSVLGGFHRGWMMFEDNNNSLDFMGGLRWTSYNKKASLSYAISTGPQDVAGVQNRFVHTALLKWQVRESLQYIMQQDYGMENNATDGRTNVGDAAWYGLNQYLLYTLNPCWKAVARFEWFRDDDGVRVFGPPPAAGIRAWPGAPGFAGNFYELTLGLNWTPGTNLIVRPELRWDWYEGQSSIAGQRPFGSFDSDNQFLFGVDAIVTY